ncbi:gamma-glutamyltransferase family protein [Thauera sinica]|uniref:Gamma-glutamyltransferase family protein n=1 Tax=Thauera sinica TaxID=2665146 RepID=A0ABW1AKR7_9RHOO|nr:gamma-glutamyltransferase family protein [Thauera sp. K11]ATE59833.1 gamma-glutamyltransferase [Thauera sp. K11]
MNKTLRSYRGMVTSPHHLASQAGLDVLKAGGNAAEAAVCVAAVLSVVYPHMSGIGGDSFWLLAPAGGLPVGVEACGTAAALATPGWYRQQGCDQIPTRGPLAALTAPATVAGWARVLDEASHWSRPLPVSELLGPAIHYAEAGFAVSRSQAELSARFRAELEPQPGFAATFMPDGEPPIEGRRLRLPRLAQTLRELASDGLMSLYRGALAQRIAAELEGVGSPLREADLREVEARIVTPLSVRIGGARLFNMPPPTQGIASLMILALFDRLGVTEGESFAHVHGLVEATKAAFRVRDAHVGCPATMSADPAALLGPSALDALAGEIDKERAQPWPHPAGKGDTTWFAVADGAGNMVSAIQSVYFEFGSGVVLPGTGITCQNRGLAFSLDGGGHRALRPGARPFHTINPALALFDDGRKLAYGTMGGEGQPQTQAAVFTRYARFGMGLQEAVTAPRWLLGRTWGENAADLKLEGRFAPELVARLREAGHELRLVEDFSDMMGHAGAIVRHPDQLLEGATDPRSDGAVAAW